MHEQSVHGRRNYPCNSCDFQEYITDYFRTHQKSVHVEEKFKCDQCDVYFSHKESISKHKQSIHEKIIYSVVSVIIIKSERKSKGAH